MVDFDDEKYMRLALAEAMQAKNSDEVPVGAVLVSAKGEVLASGYNTGEHGENAMAHAEMKVMAEGAVVLGQVRLWDCSLYVTLEPCAMCAAAVSLMRIKRLVFGAQNAKGGAVVNGVRYFMSETCNHRPEVTEGVLQEECGEVLKEFFKAKR